jgi:hypothetical protein
MTRTERCHYRGYEIVPQWQWSSWCAGIYPARPATFDTVNFGHLSLAKSRGGGRGEASYRPNSRTARSSAQLAKARELGWIV